MNKKSLAILVDSTGIDVNLLGQNADIYMQPLSITFGSETFTDIIDIKAETFYEMLATNPNHPTTSQPIIGEVINQLESLLTQYENILCISLTGKLSGTFSSFTQAAEMISSDRIKVVDTEITGPSELLLAEHALSLSKHDVPFLEIVEIIQNLISQTHLFVYIDTLTYLARSGRLSGAKALVGNLIQMKTLLAFRDGKPEVIGRVRTAKKAMLQMLDAALSELSPKTKTLYTFYADSSRPSMMDEIQQYIISKFPHINIRETIIPAVLGTNSGPGGYGISFVNGI